MPRYTAVLLDWDHGHDLGPVDVDDAQDNNAAKALGYNRAFTWMSENGIALARLQITRDGVGLGLIAIGEDRDQIKRRIFADGPAIILGAVVR